MWWFELPIKFFVIFNIFKMSKEKLLLTPGKIISKNSSNFIAGSGTYIRNGNIIASIVGKLEKVKN